ncbi:MAG: PASTA domain-containing protein [Bacteroidaceae bacterium]|nr:PASTA domain-containing protein [Bacteroidaceae bacterium]
MKKKNSNKQSFLQKCVSPMVLWNVGGMIVFVIAVLVGVSLWMDDYTRHGDNVAVPDVVGTASHYALDRLSQDNLVGIVVDSIYDDKVAPGEVTDQFPKAGSNVKAGREIHLTINSLSAPSLPMPDLADNSSRNQAEMKLRAMGFKDVRVEKTTGDLDWVYAVKSRGASLLVGQRVRVDEPVTLVVGDGSTSGEYADSTATDSDSGISDETVDAIINDLF